MMRSVGGKTGGLFKTALQSLEGRIEHCDQSCDLVVSRRDRQTLVEPLRGDPAGRLADFLNRRDRFTRDPGRTDQGYYQDCRNRSQHREENIAANLINLLEVVTRA